MSASFRLPPVLAEAMVEVAAARAKFPGVAHTTLAMAEEAGEAVKAALDLHHRKRGATPEKLRRELVQTIAMCIRVAEEGDSALGIKGAINVDTI